ncbi:hypothetical protein GIB67_001869 [Kingdonia uniflora]|uniref:AAA+ ATPase domain-containing protein n=1 Tax=Kingdonia uniflora TaxID=39325 RepID=A0A7J7LQN4_9MAGN|nr:hypothetical protein GIB67_001869 [Kingdonia uniflora]
MNYGEDIVNGWEDDDHEDVDLQGSRLVKGDNINFDEIGGLSHCIDSLKEMVEFPLVYPDFFEHYFIDPPRGILFCGPPGTGKTLTAKALSSYASKKLIGNKNVSFYMCKGGDLLSKWVGESEKMLKSLFDEARKNEPSIIFFDEIDGLAPIRSNSANEVQSSIVSTLLALMDGLDSRGQVIVIGATNRIDAIDGALRRPGRFDREFNFHLPSLEARAEIINIHTRKWKQSPSKELVMEIAGKCVGYCGADIKSLCTEAAICAFRENHPEAYINEGRCAISVSSIIVKSCHFLEAISTITPAAHRVSMVHSRPLSFVVSPLMERQLKNIISRINADFSLDTKKYPMIKSFNSSFPPMYKPRLLILGNEDAGLDHVGPAVLHELEGFPVHYLGMESLIYDPHGGKSPEVALIRICLEAKRTMPSIIYLPHFDLWWEIIQDTVKIHFVNFLRGLSSDSPILLIGTSTISPNDMDHKAASVFPIDDMYSLEKPTKDDRVKFINKLVEDVFSISPKEPMDMVVCDTPDKLSHSREVNKFKNFMIQLSGEYSIPQLEKLYIKVAKAVFEAKKKVAEGCENESILCCLRNFIEGFYPLPLQTNVKSRIIPEFEFGFTALLGHFDNSSDLCKLWVLHGRKTQVALIVVLELFGRA